LLSVFFGILFPNFITILVPQFLHSLNPFGKRRGLLIVFPFGKDLGWALIHTLTISMGLLPLFLLPGSFQLLMQLLAYNIFY